MNLAKEILLAERAFRINYAKADSWYETEEVMIKGKITNNEWYISKVRAFLIGRLMLKRKKGLI